MRTIEATTKWVDLRDKVINALKDEGITCRKTFYDAVLYDIPAITIPITTRRNIIPENVMNILKSLNCNVVGGYTKGHRTSTGKVLKFVVAHNK